MAFSSPRWQDIRRSSPLWHQNLAGDLTYLLPDLLVHAAALVQSAGVDHHHLRPCNHSPSFPPIPRRAGVRAHDGARRPPLTNQPVIERRFAHIRPADDRDPQQLRSVRRAGERGCVAGEKSDRGDRAATRPRGEPPSNLPSSVEAASRRAGGARTPSQASNSGAKQRAAPAEQHHGSHSSVIESFDKNTF